MTKRTPWKLATIAVAAALVPVATWSASAAQTPDTERPGSPAFVSAEFDSPGVVVLTWGPSTDNIGVVDYRVLRNGDQLLHTGDDRRSVVLEDLPQGRNYLQVQGIDAAGNESVRTAPTLVTVTRTHPRVPTDVTVDFDSTAQQANGFGSSISFNLADVAEIATFQVYANGVELEPVRGTLSVDPATQRHTIVLNLPGGTNHLQVAAVDAAGNASVKTAPAVLFVPTGRPSAPVILSANWVDRKVQLSFQVPTAQRPSLASLVVWRNGVEFTTLPFDAVIFDGTRPAHVNLDGLPHGRSHLQLQVISSGDMRSVKSAPLEFDVDIRPPAAPFDVRASVHDSPAPDGTRWVTVTYDLETTDGVEGCVLLRNLGPTYWASSFPQPDPDDPARFRTSDLAPAPSVAYYQVLCFDAANNQSVRSAPARIVIDAAD